MLAKFRIICKAHVLRKIKLFHRPPDASAGLLKAATPHTLSSGSAPVPSRRPTVNSVRPGREQR